MAASFLDRRLPAVLVMAAGAFAVYTSYRNGDVVSIIPPPSDRQTDDQRAFGGDAWGFGTFPGQYGMALLVDNRLKIKSEYIRTFRLFPWSRMPNALLPTRAPDEGEEASESLTDEIISGVVVSTTDLPNDQYRLTVRLAEKEQELQVAHGVLTSLLSKEKINAELFTKLQGILGRDMTDKIRVASSRIEATAGQTIPG